MKIATTALSFLSLIAAASAGQYQYDCGVYGGGSISTDGGKMDVSVNLVDVDDLAGVPLGYHLHTMWTGVGAAYSTTQCGGAYTGLHYDPTFKCGGASQARDDPQCADKEYTCSTDVAECERGDLSGKYGPLSADDNFHISVDNTGDNYQAKDSDYVSDNDDPSPKKWSSVVFHMAGGARVLCCKITPM